MTPKDCLAEGNDQQSILETATGTTKDAVPNLLSLPQELRDLIYDHVCEPVNHRVIDLSPLKTLICTCIDTCSADLRLLTQLLARAYDDHGGILAQQRLMSEYRWKEHCRGRCPGCSLRAQRQIGVKFLHLRSICKQICAEVHDHFTIRPRGGRGLLLTLPVAQSPQSSLSPSKPQVHVRLYGDASQSLAHHRDVLRKLQKTASLRVTLDIKDYELHEVDEAKRSNIFRLRKKNLTYPPRATPNRTSIGKANKVMNTELYPYGTSTPDIPAYVPRCETYTINKVWRPCSVRLDLKMDDPDECVASMIKQVGEQTRNREEHDRNQVLVGCTEPDYSEKQDPIVFQMRWMRTFWPIWAMRHQYLLNL